MWHYPAAFAQMKSSWPERERERFRNREREKDRKQKGITVHGREFGYKKLYIVEGKCTVPCPVWISINIHPIDLPLLALRRKSLIPLAKVMGHGTSLTALCQTDQC